MSNLNVLFLMCYCVRFQMQYIVLDLCTYKIFRLLHKGFNKKPPGYKIPKLNILHCKVAGSDDLQSRSL